MTNGQQETDLLLNRTSSFVPYLKVTDKAGNVDYFSSEFAVVADQTKPEIEITNLKHAEKRNIQR